MGYDFFRSPGLGLQKTVEPEGSSLYDSRTIHRLGQPGLRWDQVEAEWNPITT